MNFTKLKTMILISASMIFLTVVGISWIGYTDDAWEMQVETNNKLDDVGVLLDECESLLRITLDTLEEVQTENRRLNILVDSIAETARLSRFGHIYLSGGYPLMAEAGFSYFPDQSHFGVFASGGYLFQLREPKFTFGGGLRF